MDGILIKGVREIRNSLQDSKYACSNEQATKQALVFPLLLALGYKVFNANEVILEATADVGIKKGEKVDFKIRLNDKDVMIIECKVRNSILSTKEIDQLYRYYSTSDVDIAILTNGDDYWFFTDRYKKNVMDTEPYKKIRISSLDTDMKIDAALDKYTRQKILELDINKEIGTSKFHDELIKVIDSILNGDIPNYVLDAIAEHVELSEGLEKISDSYNIKELILKRVENSRQTLENTSNEVVIKTDDSKIGNISKIRYNRDIESGSEYTYREVVNKNLEYCKLEYIILGGVKIYVKSMKRAYIKIVDYVLSKDIDTLNKLLKKRTKFQLEESFSPTSRLDFWYKESKVVPNLMIFGHGSNRSIIEMIHTVLSAGNISYDDVIFSFKVKGD